FPRKIKVGRLIKPGKGDDRKISIVPTTVEEKFIHDNLDFSQQEGTSGGSGEGEEGEVIGEEPIDQGSEGEGGAGEGGGGAHEVESDAYDLGRILTEKFELPNLQNKGKKRSLTNYTYELTDTHQGTGQLLDKKSTLRQIVDTNIILGNITPDGEINTQDLLISPNDKIYRILSREKDYESQAIVFFIRDYSGSMWGKSTEIVVAQHVLIYSWLLYQYSRQVETRFILHDTEAKEVPDFYSYYNSRVAGGTKIVSAYNMVTDIIEQESLYRDYNIYIFHGTDGDDWDSEGKQTLPALRNMLAYANRIGISIAANEFSGRKSNLHSYLEASNLLTEKSDYLRADIIPENADETRLIEGIRHLTSEGESVA
ncbi:MAG: DUF444 family protein, partial [Thermodesulfobacteriota bacterium]